MVAVPRELPNEDERLAIGLADTGARARAIGSCFDAARPSPSATARCIGGGRELEVPCGLKSTQT
jgi:hypothetical protein